LINFHIISAYNSEISSELSEYSEWAWKKIRNCPNTPNDLQKKFGIVRILRMTSEKNSELSEYSEWPRKKIRNSELRSETTTLIRKISSDSEIIPSYLWENFRISFATFGAISELHSEKNSELYLEKIPKLHLLKSFRTTFGQKFCINFFIHKFP
jgi:hypothetical protein